MTGVQTCALPISVRLAPNPRVDTRDPVSRVRLARSSNAAKRRVAYRFLLARPIHREVSEVGGAKTSVVAALKALAARRMSSWNPRARKQKLAMTSLGDPLRLTSGLAEASCEGAYLSP